MCKSSFGWTSLIPWTFILFVGFALPACQLFPAPSVPPVTSIEKRNSNSYIPLESPLPVYIDVSQDCKKGEKNFKNILDSLPDNAVRIAVGQFDSSGTLVYGPVKLGIAGNSYQITLDYVNVDVVNVPMYVERIENATTSSGNFTVVRESVFNNTITSPTQYFVHQDPTCKKEFLIPLGCSATVQPQQSELPLGADKIFIPTYFGVGLRLTATVNVIKGSANLSSLSSIAAEAEAGKITGSMVVQTLGVTGQSVVTKLSLSNELNQTTIKNAISALDDIKENFYKLDTKVTPRIVGIYIPFGGGQQVIDGIISILASYPFRWNLTCDVSGK